MKMFLVLFILLFSPIASAQIIELNSQNPDACRQQLLQSNDTNPIIFMYNKDCPHAQKVLPVYIEVSNKVKSRTFFTYDFSENDGFDYLRAITAHGCLGFLPGYSPLIGIYSVMPASNTSPGEIGGLMRLNLFGEGTTANDILQFIGVGNFSKTSN